MSKMYTKIEKNFYSSKNYNLLDKIIVNSVDNIKNITNDYKKLLFSHMEKVFSSKQFSNDLTRTERGKILTSLNKEVLASVASYIKNPKTKQVQKNLGTQKGPQIQNISNKEIQLQRDNSGLYKNFFEQNNTFQKPSSYSQNTPIQPLSNQQPFFQSPLQPKDNVQYFPKQRQDSQNYTDTNTMFQKLEETRSNDSGSKKPSTIDFTLPENTSSSSKNTSIEDLVKERKQIENIYNNSTFHPSKSSNETPIYTSFTDGVHTYTNNSTNNSTNTQNKEIRHVTFAPLSSIEESPKNIQSSINVHRNTNIDSQRVQNANIDSQRVQNTNIDIKRVQNANIDSQRVQNANIQNTDIRGTNKDYPSIKLTNEETIYNSLEASIESSLEKSLEKYITNYFYKNQNIDIDSGGQQKEKVLYVAISSLYRKNKHITPTNSVLSWKKEENDVILHDTILFTKPEKDISLFSIDSIENILSVECLDVIVPNIDIFQKEPYIWLCIKEWSSNNKGTNIPKNAFTRLKEISTSSSVSPYISLKSHIFDRKTPTNLENILSLELRTSDNTPIICNDMIHIQNILNTSSFQVSNTDNIKKNDIVYLFSYFPKKYIPFYTEIYVYNIKILEKDTLSFRLCIHKNTEDIGNKICIFSKNDISIPIEKYISTSDLFFIEYKKRNTIYSSSYKIKKIQNGIITIQFPQKTKYILTNITKIGFYSMSKQGYNMNELKVQNIENNTITINKEFPFQDWNRYFLLSKKYQTHYYFRINYL